MNIREAITIMKPSQKNRNNVKKKGIPTKSTDNNRVETGNSDSTFWLSWIKLVLSRTKEQRVWAWWRIQRRDTHEEWGKSNKRRDDVERGEHGIFWPWLQHLYLFSI